MQRGAYEAIYLSRPVVTSNFRILRESFPIGAVYVDSTANDIARGIREMTSDLARYRNEAGELQMRKLERWKAVEQELQARFRASHKETATPVTSVL